MQNSRGGGKSISIELLEDRRLLSVSPLDANQVYSVVIGKHAATSVAFLAGNGKRTYIVVGGATATVTFTGPLAPNSIDGYFSFPSSAVETVDSIVIANAVPHAASLHVLSLPASSFFDIGSISGGDISSINAPQVSLTGSMDLTSVNYVLLGQVSGAAMNLGSSAAGVRVLGTMTGSLTAETLGKVSASELVKADISTTGTFSKSKLQIGSIDGGAGIEQSEITAAGNIGSVKANFIEDSVITAATNAPAAPAGHYPVSLVPESSADFTQPGTIHSILITHKGNGGFFNDSVIAADTIASAQLGQLGTEGGGVAAHHFGSLSFVSPTGGLDQYSLHLGSGALHTSAKLAATLSNKGIDYRIGLLGADNVVVFGLNLNVLR